MGKHTQYRCFCAHFHKNARASLGNSGDFRFVFTLWIVIILHSLFASRRSRRHSMLCINIYVQQRYTFRYTKRSLDYGFLLKRLPRRDVGAAIVCWAKLVFESDARQNAVKDRELHSCRFYAYINIY